MKFIKKMCLLLLGIGGMLVSLNGVERDICHVVAEDTTENRSTLCIWAGLNISSPRDKVSYPGARIVLTNITIDSSLGFDNNFYNDFVKTKCINDFPTDTEINEVTLSISIPFPIEGYGGLQLYRYLPWYIYSCDVSVTNAHDTLVPTGFLDKSQNLGRFRMVYYSDSVISRSFNTKGGTSVGGVTLSYKVDEGNLGTEEINKYDIVSEPNNGNFGTTSITSAGVSQSSGSYIEKQKITLNASPLGSVTFNHWEANVSGVEVGDNATFTTYVSKDVTYTAYFTPPASPTIVTLYDGDGATGGSETVEATLDEPIKNVKVPQKANHSFQGYWDLSEGGTKYIDALGNGCKNWDKTDATYTLYAHWNYEMPNAIAFASSFNTTIGGICNPYGGTSKSSLEAVWGTENKEVDTLSKAFFALNEVAQGILTAAKRPTQSTSTDPLELFAAKYDYVCGKYSLYNFASRTPLYPQSATPYKINDVADGSNASIIIILIACISSALAIGGYFLIKRKREE